MYGLLVLDVAVVVCCCLPMLVSVDVCRKCCRWYCCVLCVVGAVCCVLLCVVLVGLCLLLMCSGVLHGIGCRFGCLMVVG